MKIVYCTHSLCSPGGMERVLSFKASYLSRVKGWDITIVTTDQKGRAPYFDLHARVRLIDLDINYSDDNHLSPLRKITGYIWRRRLHKRRLAPLLESLRPDLLVSLFPSESSFLPRLLPGCPKILEFHYGRYFRLQYNRTGLLGLIDRLRTRSDLNFVRSFGCLVVLTRQDAAQWGALPNLRVIPNPVIGPALRPRSTLLHHRVIAVGRLDYQKGFDRLLEIWRLLHDSNRLGDWRLDIFGRGEWRERLRGMIARYRLTSSVSINEPTADIDREYAESSILAVTSNYEGFPLVMLEASAAGLPIVSFDCPCGPAEMIRDNDNGFLVPMGDNHRFANSLATLISSYELRRRMGERALERVAPYSEDIVMRQWINLFGELCGTSE